MNNATAQPIAKSVLQVEKVARRISNSLIPYSRLFWRALKLANWSKGHAKFTTSGAHDVIAITSLPKNDLCTEELRDIDWTRSV